MCALERDDQVPKADILFRECGRRFLGRWIHALDPALVILMGGRAKQYHAAVLAAAPESQIQESMHYAVGGSHRAQLGRETSSIAATIARIRAAAG
jgi:hypothetical protein